MNKHIKRFLIIVFIFIATIAGWVTYSTIEARTLSRSIDEHIEVFIPHGMPDEFEDEIPFGDIQRT
ncbi:MAG: hypothetical protein NC110_04415 [Ruminococcus sp.]|nr:hypothetical protein [Ruminococcus sp.]